MVHATKYSLLLAIYSNILMMSAAILDFGVLEMSYDQINVRNGFPMLNLVKNEFFDHSGSSKIKNFENV